MKVRAKTDKGYIEFNLPTSWAEVTFEQFIRIERDWDRKDVVSLFSILAGIEFEILEQSEDEDLESLVYQATSFCFGDKMEWKELKPPRKLLIGTKLCDVPQINTSTLGQKIMLNQYIVEAKNTADLMLDTMALYFQPVYSGEKFDRTKMDEIKELLFKCNAIDCYAISSFFLQNRNVFPRLGHLGYLARLRRGKSHSKNLQAQPD